MECLDSDIIIDFLKGRDEAVNYIKKSKEELATTSINVFEVYFGGYKIGKTKCLEDFFSSLKILTLDYNASKKAAEIGTKLSNEGRQIEVKDLLIASICIVNGYTLVTSNIKHFSRINELKLKNWRNEVFY
ncbi:PilT protein domain protein [Sulfolobus islandicus L.S.2.15]|uniref:PilT protein domain protein n=1 Tax=Saccharolobus islandicus (strain L.S.2.15 / Lassen \|nr:type II toxin-antitoxin system VapC family toxin [Sulfolobus islandicus]ACP34659.1 PilT protein domain protein [Sulfolobus islandicus L.S.2.15]